MPIVWLEPIGVDSCWRPCSSPVFGQYKIIGNIPYLLPGLWCGCLNGMVCVLATIAEYHFIYLNMNCSCRRWCCIAHRSWPCIRAMTILSVSTNRSLIAIALNSLTEKYSFVALCHVTHPSYDMSLANSLEHSRRVLHHRNIYPDNPYSVAFVLSSWYHHWLRIPEYHYI
jgi:hypothetical protein